MRAPRLTELVRAANDRPSDVRAETRIDELREPADEPTRDLSPTARVVLATQDLDPIAAACAARLIEAYAALDADRKVLLMAVAQTFRERCERG